MSTEHPNILYIGDIERGHALEIAAETHGSYVHLAEDVMDALGMYVVYLPDVIIIDAVHRYTLAQEVYMHLRSVDAKPMLVLANSETPGLWHGAEPAVKVLPYTITRDELIIAAHEAVQEQRVTFE